MVTIVQTWETVIANIIEIAWKSLDPFLQYIIQVRGSGLAMFGFMITKGQMQVQKCRRNMIVQGIGVLMIFQVVRGVLTRRSGLQGFSI